MSEILIADTNEQVRLEQGARDGRQWRAGSACFCRRGCTVSHARLNKPQQCCSDWPRCWAPNPARRCWTPWRTSTASTATPGGPRRSPARRPATSSSPGSPVPEGEARPPEQGGRSVSLLHPRHGRPSDRGCWQGRASNAREPSRIQQKAAAARVLIIIGARNRRRIPGRQRSMAWHSTPSALSAPS